LTAANDLAVCHALEAAGVEFIDDEGGARGALRQRPRPRPKSNSPPHDQGHGDPQSLADDTGRYLSAVSSQWVFGRCPTRFGSEDVTPHPIIARGTCVRSVREAACAGKIIAVVRRGHQVLDSIH